MIKRHFDDKTQIFHVLYTGIIELEDIVENIHRSFQDTHLPKRLRVLEDAREASYNLSIEANEKILQTMGLYVEKFEFIKVAMVQDKPYEAAVNLDYEYRMPFPNFWYKVFSTEKSALLWLNIDF